jgi:hypothetical protein
LKKNKKESKMKYFIFNKQSFGINNLEFRTDEQKLPSGAIIRAIVDTERNQIINLSYLFDSHTLKQIVYNIIKDARKFMKEQGADPDIYEEIKEPQIINMT